MTTKNLNINIFTPAGLWLLVRLVPADSKRKPLKKGENPQLILKRDINNGQIYLYSLEKELALGRQMAAEMHRFHICLENVFGSVFP
jgi:hypothetical protein